jgi:hypothetical protein
MGRRKKTYGWILSLEWHNPYTEPPDGQPRILGAVYLRTDHQGAGAPRPPESLLAHSRPGSGYFLSYAEIREEPVPWTMERKFKYRRGRLMARLQKKAPMFAAQLYAEEIAKRPDYFGPAP